MIAARDIEKLVDAIAERFAPERIILFGSYAYGTPTAASDVDLMVVHRYRGSMADAMSRVRRSVDADFPFDVFVRSPREVERRLAEPDMFLWKVVNEGTVLYDPIDRRVGSQGRRRLRRRPRVAAVA